MRGGKEGLPNFYLVVGGGTVSYTLANWVSGGRPVMGRKANSLCCLVTNMNLTSKESMPIKPKVR